MPQHMPNASQWLSPHYGCPDATSEVSRIAGFYAPANLSAFGTRPEAPARPGSPEQSSATFAPHRLTTLAAGEDGVSAVSG